MYINGNTLIYLSKAVGAAGVLLGAVIAVGGWALKIKRQQSDINDMKTENTLVCYALLACLDGLEQLGANHTVTKAKDKLEKYLNQQAHQ